MPLRLQKLDRVRTAAFFQLWGGLVPTGCILLAGFSKNLPGAMARVSLSSRQGLSDLQPWENFHGLEFSKAQGEDYGWCPVPAAPGAVPSAKGAPIPMSRRSGVPAVRPGGPGT